VLKRYPIYVVIGLLGVDIWMLIKTYCICVILRSIERSEMEKLPANLISYRTGEYVRWLLVMAVIICGERSCLF